MKESEALEFHHPKAFAYLLGDYFTLFFLQSNLVVAVCQVHHRDGDSTFPLKIFP